VIAQIALTITGLWLIAAPSVLDSGDAAATSAHIAGPAMAAVAFLAVFTITRPLRWANLPTGLWLLTAPWVLGFPTEVTINSTLCGLLALVLAPIGKANQNRYGGGWHALLDTTKLAGTTGKGG
jgi:hypothetical protein